MLIFSMLERKNLSTRRPGKRGADLNDAFDFFVEMFSDLLQASSCKFQAFKVIAQGDEDDLSFVLSEPTTLEFAPREFEVYALRRADGAMTRVFYAMELLLVCKRQLQTGDHGTEARISIAPHTQCDLLKLDHAEIQRTLSSSHSHATIRNVAADWDEFSDFESPVELSLADDFVLGPLRLETP